MIYILYLMIGLGVAGSFLAYTFEEEDIDKRVVILAGCVILFIWPAALAFVIIERYR